MAQLSFIAQGMNDLRMSISELPMPFVVSLSNHALALDHRITSAPSFR